jgi:hypothetical protein
MMDDVVRDYIDAIAPEQRPLFDRLHRLVLEAHPDAAVVLSYQMPTYKVGRRRLFVGVWKHGVSIYGWEQGRDAGSPPATPSSRRAKAQSSCGPTPPPASPTTSSATWCTPPSTADQAEIRHQRDGGTSRLPLSPPPSAPTRSCGGVNFLNCLYL